MQNDLILNIKNLKKEFENVVTFSSINIDIHKREGISIIGPSGTGKSTLLNCIN